MTDISKKIEAALDDYFGFCDNHAGIDKQEAVEGITKIIEEERAGWVERVAKEVEAVAPVITKLKSVDDELVLVVSDFPDADVIYLYEKDVVAIIRNSKEEDADEEKYDGLNPKDL